MVQYRIQNLLDHLQTYIKPNNPNHDILAAEHVAWIDSSCFLNDAHKKAWKDAEMPLLACRVFPESSLGALRVCLEYMIVSLLLEHLTDAPTTTSEAQKWADIFSQGFKQTLEEIETPAAAILKQLRKPKWVPLAMSNSLHILDSFIDQVLNAIKGPYHSDIVKSNILVAEGVVKEAADRENPYKKLTLEAYVKARRDTIGIRPIFVIGRWIHGIDIAQEVLTNRDILKLEEQFSDLGFLANDLYSYKKEWFQCGAHHNYVTIALGDPTTGLRENDRQGAIDYTCRKFCEVLADIEHQKKMLPSFGKSEDVKVAMYIELMMDVVVANIQWSLSIPRYGHFGIAGTAEAPNWGDVIFDMDPL